MGNNNSMFRFAYLESITPRLHDTYIYVKKRGRRSITIDDEKLRTLLELNFSVNEITTRGL